MSGLLSHSKNSIPVWFRLFWRAEELHALSYVLLTLLTLVKGNFMVTGDLRYHSKIVQCSIYNKL